MRLYAGGLVPLLDDARFVDEPDDPQFIGLLLARRRQKVLDDVALGLLEQGVVVPAVVGEELLERAHGRARRQRHRLDGLAGEVAEQAPAVGAQMQIRLLPPESTRESTRDTK